MDVNDYINQIQTLKEQNLQVLPKNKTNFTTNSAMATIDESQIDANVDVVTTKKEEEQAKRVEEERNRITQILE